MTKKTSLFEDHKRYGGKIVDFAGWQMPVQYEGLSIEHEACRKSVGIFDVSHMGEIRVRGKNALPFLNSILTNDLSVIKDNQIQYSVMCNPSGGCIDDLVVHRLNADEYFICVNASNTDKDFEWIKKNAPADVIVTNESQHWSQIALQGRNAEKILQTLCDVDLKKIKTYWFETGTVCNENCYIARTGYTGEDGFEIYAPWDSASKIWNALNLAGKEFNIKPCGLGARDTLRTEMKYALYGHEIDENILPIEAGLSWVTKLNKQNFIGKDAMIRLKNSGIKKTSIGLKSLSRAIPRQGYAVENLAGEVIGHVTSGTMSPSLKIGIAIASIDKKYSELGTKLNVIVRDQKVEHEVVQTPFYKRDY